MRTIRILSAVMILLLLLGILSPFALASGEMPETGTDLPAAQTIRNRYLMRGGIGVGIVLVLCVLPAVRDLFRRRHGRKRNSGGRR